MKDPIGFLLFIIILLFIVEKAGGPPLLHTIWHSFFGNFQFHPPFNRTTSSHVILIYRPLTINSVLYHGTPKPEFANSICSTNSFLIKNHNPLGIYLSDCFDVARGYGALNGCVVMVWNKVPPEYTADFSDVQNDPRYQQWINKFGNSGESTSRFIYQVLQKRLIKFGSNVFVAIVPYHTESTYYRVEGLQPLKILNHNKQVIKTINYS